MIDQVWYVPFDSLRPLRVFFSNMQSKNKHILLALCAT
jgi:hypothetical protein